MDKTKKADILKVKERYEERLFSFPNVVGVGIGNKVIRNIATNRLCLKVYVQKKVAKAKLRKGQIVPKKLSGVETDIEEVGKIGAL